MFECFDLMRVTTNFNLRVYGIKIIVHDIDNKKTLIEELSENIFLLVTESGNDIDDENEGDSIKECIVDISNMDIKNNKSLSNKTVFKHLDMLDEIN